MSASNSQTNKPVIEERKAEIVKRLRLGIPAQSCQMCKDDSATFVRCGRGTCAWEGLLMEEAADIIEQSAGPHSPVHADNIEVMISSLLSVVQYDMRASAEKDLRALVEMARASSEAGKDGGK